MKILNSDRARILVHALPYIQKYNNKTVVIKYGGSAMTDERLKDSVMRDIVLLNTVGVRVVLVHGGGNELTDMLKKIGKKSEFVGGLRVTDKETAEMAQMVLAGKVNKDLVKLIESRGGKAIGLSGIDGSMIKATAKDEKLGFVGKVTGIDIKPVKDLLEKGYIPVISSLGCDEQGDIYNINADTAAAEIASALGAESMFLLTDTVGILRQKDNEDSLIPRLTPEKAEQLKAEGVISGGMIPKAECCVKAVNGGVERVFIIDGRISHSILIEMFTDEGIGTMFKKYE